ncbi:MAG: hypothetical protein JXB60_00905, partial [Candidatus Cloacimonetes bacterium]|nr:hypothetical protein [Candidatus Cloacimonadota bacterium]
MKMERILVFSLLLIVVTLPAEWIAISPDRSQELFTCEPADLATATVTFTLDGYELENIEQEGLRYSRISYGNEGRILEVGKPDLPCFTRLIA